MEERNESNSKDPKPAPSAATGGETSVEHRDGGPPTPTAAEGECSKSEPKDDPFQVQERLAMLFQKCSLLGHDLPTEEKKTFQDLKRGYLASLINFGTVFSHTITPEMHPHIIDMFAKNVFRRITSSEIQEYNIPCFYEETKYKKQVDTNWHHLDLVYELFIKFIKSDRFVPNVAGESIDQTFVRHLFHLLQLRDKKERKHLKSVLCEIHNKMPPLRACIKREVINALCCVLDQFASEDCVAEVLKIAAEVTEEIDEKIVLKVLLPLHRLESLPLYSKALSKCLTLYLSKDRKLYVKVISYLIKFWPYNDIIKQYAVTEELEDLLEDIKLKEFRTVMVPLFRLLASYVMTPHSQVARKVLTLLNNSKVISLTQDNFTVLFPIILPPLQMMRPEPNLQQMMDEINKNMSIRVASCSPAGKR